MTPSEALSTLLGCLPATIDRGSVAVPTDALRALLPLAGAVLPEQIRSDSLRHAVTVEGPGVDPLPLAQRFEAYVTGFDAEAEREQAEKREAISRKLSDENDRLRKLVAAEQAQPFAHATFIADDHGHDEPCARVQFDPGANLPDPGDRLVIYREGTRPKPNAFGTAVDEVDGLFPDEFSLKDVQGVGRFPAGTRVAIYEWPEDEA